MSNARALLMLASRAISYVKLMSFEYVCVCVCVSHKIY